jgi:hypothetical protein
MGFEVGGLDLDRDQVILLVGWLVGWPFDHRESLRTHLRLHCLDRARHLAVAKPVEPHARHLRQEGLEGAAKRVDWAFAYIRVRLKAMYVACVCK